MSNSQSAQKKTKQGHSREGQYIQCKICGLERESLGWRHLSMHGLTPKEYKEKFGVTFLYSDELRWKISTGNKAKTTYRRYRPRSREDILKDIKNFAKKRWPLTCSWLERRAPGLPRQAIATFGTWYDTLEAADLNPSKNKDWSRAEVIKEIKQRAKKKQSLTAGSVREEDLALYSASSRYFSSWGDAISAAGLDISKITGSKDRSKKAVQRDLRLWVKEHGSLNSTSLKQTEIGLQQAACRWYGSVRKAARALKLPHYCRPRSPQ